MEGEIDTVRSLNNETPKLIEELVEKIFEMFFEYVGFVFNTGCNVLPDVPQEIYWQFMMK